MARTPEIIEIDLEDIPDPISHPSCRLCKWYLEYPELYKWVYERAMSGFPYTRIHILLTEFLAENAEVYNNLKPMTKKAVWNHFEKHMSPQESAKLISARSHFVAQDGIKLVPEALISTSTAEEFDEYKEMCDLFVRFREVHNTIYEMTRSLQKGNVDGGEVWSQSKIQTFNSMINTQKSILAEIAKMRQSNKIISVATKFIVETYSKSVVGKLREEFTTLIAVLKRQGVSDDIMEVIEEMGSIKLAEILINEADSAMGRTKQEFKLPN